MPFKLRVALLFGFAGILPLLFFSIQDISNGSVEVFNKAYFLRKAISLVSSYLVTLLVSSAVIFGPISFLEKKLPWNKNLLKRAIFELIFTSATAVVARNFTVNIMVLMGMLDYGLFSETYWNRELVNAVMAIFMNLFLVSAYEGIVLFRYWKNSLVANERLEKENVISKFEALKNQVNPHFLFNSLNTLSNLVHEDADKAEAFIDEFSYIYRYVLEKKDQLTVSLQEELMFVQSYLTLCQIRFGKALDSTFEIDPAMLDTKLPTLALQTLIENAIKHNKITPDEPLRLYIYNEQEYVVVENNYQKRKQASHSTGLGISNLMERYKLLTSCVPTFEKADGKFTAKIPLLKTG